MPAAPILLVEDTLTLQMVYEAVLRKAGHDVVGAANAAEGAAVFGRTRPEVVVLDLGLPDRDGLALMRDMLRERPGLRVIVATANGSLNLAVEAMREGACEFLVKPFEPARLLEAVNRAQAEARRAAPTPGTDNSAAFEEFIGSSAIMRELYRRITSVGRSSATVFITGESGTGKELCAQALHNCSPRARGPFVPLNCGAIPGDLLESEVFGHRRGAFTGAVADKPGAATAADGGTLFLDEICEMDLALQAKLLRFLQTGMVQPLGEVSARRVDVRIVCATNRNPVEEVRRGRMREDLFYRLHVVPIHLPPLRERGSDVIEIAEASLREFAARDGKEFATLSAEVRALFMRMPWPGNVRQLRNVIRNVVVFHDGSEVTPEMLPADVLSLDLGQRPAGPAAPEPVGAAPAPPTRNLPDTEAAIASLAGQPLAQVERWLIEATLARCAGSVPAAARLLEVAPSTLYRKIASWDRSEDPGSPPTLRRLG